MKIGCKKEIHTTEDTTYACNSASYMVAVDFPGLLGKINDDTDTQRMQAGRQYAQTHIDTLFDG